MGGVSARILDMGGPKDIIREVEGYSPWGRFGGVILASGHSLKYPEEKMEIMYRTWVDKGLYKAKAPNAHGKHKCGTQDSA